VHNDKFLKTMLLFSKKAIYIIYDKNGGIGLTKNTLIKFITPEYFIIITIYLQTVII